MQSAPALLPLPRPDSPKVGAQNGEDLALYASLLKPRLPPPKANFPRDESQLQQL